MVFQTIETALISLLGTSLAGQATVVGYQKQARDQDTVAELSRNVTVFYSGGQFPKNRGRTKGPILHEVTFKLGFLVSASATVDLTVLDNVNSTAGQIQTALTAMLDANYRAEALLNDLWSRVWNILRLPSNDKLGLTGGEVADLWLDDFQKGEAQPRGEMVTINASATLTLSTVETPADASFVPAATGVQSDFKVTADKAASPLDTSQNFDTAAQGVKR